VAPANQKQRGTALFFCCSCAKAASKHRHRSGPTGTYRSRHHTIFRPSISRL
jgi:hypothetical protein